MTPPEPSIQSTRRKGTPFRLSLMLGWLLLLAYALWLLHNAAPLLASSPRPPLPELVARTIALPPVLTTPGVYLAAALSVLMLLLLIVLLALTVAPLPALEAHTAPGTQDTSEQPQVAPLTQPEPVETMEPTNVTDVSEAAEAAEASEVSEALSAAAADAHPSASEDVAPSHIEVEEVEEAVNATPAPTGDAADAPAGEARPAPPRGRQGVKSQRVFISSTSRDLYAHRQRVHDDLERMYQVPVDMAQFGAGGTDATTVSYTELATADIVVLIVAWRYGFIPAGEIHAVTELEYEEARRLKLPIYVYLADPATEAQDGPDALFPAETRQPEYAAQLAAFRAGLSDPNANTYGTFDSPADLSSRVGTALTRRLLREPLPGRLTPVEGRTLDRRSFRMGDDDAATFDYQIAPLQGAWEAATQALANASVEIGGKRGIIVLGEANAGKTRLALEALIATLPDWRTLIWSEAATSADAQKVAGLPDEQLVVFIDDLQRYAPMTQRGADGRMTALASNPAAILRDLISAITARTLVIVATCRSEDEQPTHAELSWLFDKLMEVRVPQFSANTADHDSQRVIAAFATHGATHLGDWDGSLGSLVLGLSTKRAQYEILATQRHPAVDVLRAMKLLTAAEVYQHTERRLRAVCAGVFHDQMIATRARAWEDAYRELLRLQFARIAEDASDDDDGAITLVIRKDTYFDADKVITDYPNPDDPGQLARHLAALQSVFVAQGDFDGLFSLGGMYYDHGDYVRALAAYDRALALRPDHADTWYNKGVALGQAGRTEEALAAYDRALALRPDHADTWYNKGVALGQAGRTEEELAAYD
ncbi:MAG: tetratricopeptide repeat protein, partial [Ktedonobacterales bacterium]